MKKLNENAAALLNNQSIWYLGTFGAEPNAVPVFFKAIAEDGTLLVADVFMNKTLRNVEANGKISISACDAQTMEGYQLKGTAVHLKQGEEVEAFKKIVGGAFDGALKCKGVLKITPEKIFVTTPGPRNGEAC